MNMKPKTFDSRTPRGSSSIPTVVIASIECCKTAGESSWTSSISGDTVDSSWPMGRADACVAVFAVTIFSFRKAKRSRTLSQTKHPDGFEVQSA